MKRRKRGKEESRRWLNSTKQSKGREDGKNLLY